jgi:uncharacterized protein (TIGR00369 family)
LPTSAHTCWCDIRPAPAIETEYDKTRANAADETDTRRSPDMDRNAFFWQIQDGKLPPPPAAATLGIRILEISPEAGTIEVEFQGKPEFTNPAGHVQGGFLAAMLDDTMGPLVSSTLQAGEFAPTLNLNVSFARPASVGKLIGKGRIVRRGKEVCLLAGELYQKDELVATATATAIVRRLGGPPPGA